MLNFTEIIDDILENSLDEEDALEVLGVTAP